MIFGLAFFMVPLNDTNAVSCNGEVECIFDNLYGCTAGGSGCDKFGRVCLSGGWDCVVGTYKCFYGGGGAITYC